MKKALLTAAGLAVLGASSQAIVIYDNTASVGSGTRPVGSINWAATSPPAPVTSAMLYDDVNLDMSQFAVGTTQVKITKVTFSMYSNSAGVTSGFVGAYFGEGNPGTTGTNAAQFASGTVDNLVTLGQNDVTIGDGTTELFTVNVDTSEVAGFGRFYFGLEAQSPNIGFWRGTGATVTDEMYAWDLTNDRLFGFSGTGNQLFLKLEGEAVPEPATMAVFGLGLAGIAARRRRASK